MRAHIGRNPIFHTCKVGRDGTNYAELKNDGELELHGTARVTRHVSVDAAGFTKVAGGSPPLDAGQGTFGVLLFDAAGTEEAFYNFHMPHDWDPGTNITVFLFWSPTEDTDAKHVQWELDWETRQAENDEVIGAGSTNIELHDVTQGTAWEVLKTPEGTISGAALAVDEVVGMKVSRLIEAGDTYDGQDAALIHLEIEYIKDQLGEAT